MRMILPLLVLLAVCGAGLAFLAWREDDPGTIVEAEIGGARFAFPRGYARDEATAAGGFAERLAFVARFPDFAPLARRGRGSASQSPRAVVAITLSPKDDGADPAERPAVLYSRFFEADVWPGPAGLILRRFERGSPYDLEQIYLAPPDGRSFFARCPKTETAGPATTAEPCLTIFRKGALDVELRFPPALLEHWEALGDGARSFVDGLTARKRPKK